MIGNTFNVLSSLVVQSAQQLFFYSVPSAHTQILINAIANNDLNTFCQALKNQPNYEAKGFPRSLLHEAIQQQKIDFVVELLRRGVALNDICEGVSPLGRAIQLGNVSIAELLIQHGADLNCATLQALPRVLDVAVKQKKMPLREAELITNQMCAFPSFQYLTPLLSPIHSLIKLEEDALKAYQHQYQQAVTAFSQIEMIRNIHTLNARFEMNEDDIQVPELIVRYPTKYPLIKLKTDLDAATPYSPEWHYLESVLRHQQALAMSEETTPITEFAKACQSEFLKSNIKTAIKLEPEFNSKAGFKIQFNYPSFKAISSVKYKNYINTLAPYLPMGNGFIDAIRNRNEQDAVKCFQDEIAAETEPTLHMACRLQSHHMVELLLSSGANVTQVFNNSSPLQVAIAQKDEKLAALLVEKGANPNELIDGKSVLHVAALNNWPLLTRALIRTRANLASTFAGETALDAAFRLGHLEVLKEFQHEETTLLHFKSSNYSKRCNGYPRYTAFDWHTAISTHDNEAVNILSLLKCDPNQLDNRFGSPLHHAILLGDDNLVARLLNLDADPRIPFQNYNALQFALMLAKKHGGEKRYKVVETLILNNTVTRLNMSKIALFNFCIHHQLLDGANYLLDSGLSGTWMNTPASYPPLLTTIRSGAFAFVPKLLEHNAQLDTAAWCLQNNHLPPLNQAIHSQDIDLIALLIRDAGPSVANTIDKPLLHEAIVGNGYQQASSDIMLFLIHQGADVNELYRDYTPLQAAIIKYQDRAIDCLLTYGGANLDLNRKNAKGDTALHLALRKVDSSAFFFDISSRLINEGADIFIENNQGECPFDIIMLNPNLRDKMIERHGEAFINENIQKRNCLGVILSNEAIQSALLNDPLIGATGLNWLKAQISHGTHAAEACLASLVAHDAHYGQFISEHLGATYFNFIKMNLATLLVRFELMRTAMPVVTAFENYQNQPAAVQFNDYSAAITQSRFKIG